MYEEYYVTLPGGFRLPIALCVDEYIVYDMQAAEIPRTDAEKSLSDFSERYLIQQMIAGEIRDKYQTISLEDGVYRLEGEYVCVEMIGRIQRAQIGETNGKSG